MASVLVQALSVMVTRDVLMARTKYCVNVLPNNSSVKALNNVLM
jgi:hypothetical protein